MAKWKDESMADLLAEVQDNSVIKYFDTIEIGKLTSFKDHPFKLYTERKMDEMIESIKENGILNPLLVRPIQDGNYEIIAGHNRWEAAKKAGLEEVPIIIKDVNDEMATIMMVDTNFNQREEILPSEKAFAYKMKLDAENKQGQRTDLTYSHGDKKLSAESIGEKNQDSVATVYRFVRLTELIPGLLNKVDSGELGFIPAVDISYLTDEQQGNVEDVMDIGKVKPTKAQAAELKRKAQEGTLTKRDIQLVLNTKKEEKFSAWKVNNKRLLAYLPQSMIKEMTLSKADEIFHEAMILWQKENEDKYDA